MAYRPKDLQTDIDDLNRTMRTAKVINQRGFIVQFELSPRNGYQAVDAYSIRDDGTRENSGVDCNVGCGTSLECFQYMRSHYYNLCDNQDRYPL